MRWKKASVAAVVVLIAAVLLVLRFRAGAEQRALADLGRDLAELGALAPPQLLRPGGTGCSLQTPAGPRLIPADGLLQPRSMRMVSGWLTVAPAGLWGIGASSAIEVQLADSDPRELELVCRSLEPAPGEQGHQTISISLNGYDCAAVAVGRELQTLRVALPQQALQVGLNRFDLVYSYHASSRDLGSGDDPAQRAVYFTRIALRRVGGRPGLLAGWLSRLAAARSSPQLHYDHEHRQLRLTGSSTLVVPLQLPATARVLSLTGRLLGDRSASARLALHRLDGSLAGLLTVHPGPPDQEHFSLSAPISEHAGTTCLLELTADLPQPGGLLELTLPKLVSRPASGDPQQPPVRPGPGATAPLPPDIVVVIFDAARPDHLGCYGYHRQTSPNLDRLAAESLVFRNASALVPNTTVSVPTMVTGLSFLRHGVVGRGLRLGASATTLAELLHDAGYHTIGITATPNSSRKTGIDQGYEVFHETWRDDCPAHQRRDPFRQSDLAINALAAAPPGQPLHLLLHYVPPHEPYRPGPRFDRFTDPGYDGPCTGDRDGLAAIRSGALQPGPAGLQHLVDLYDGNQLRVDEAFARVLAALRQRPGWQRTVVLVTADHGEAFLEHGFQGHNATTYDEMLRVPFVLRLPPQLQPPVVDTSRLVTLADIVPTLLGVAGIDAPEQLDGIDLLAPGPAAGDRFLVARNLHPEPAWALRSARWKVIVGNAGTGELYDLVADPEERDNLIERNEPIFAGLVKLLELRLLAAPQQSHGEVRPTLDDRDRAALEALGYL